MELLKSLGADVVVTPSILGDPEAYSRVVAGMAAPRLGLNCTGGSIASLVRGALPSSFVWMRMGARNFSSSMERRCSPFPLALS